MKKSFLLFIVNLISSALIAQKKPLDHTAYDSWQHIGEKIISNDGRWVVYTIEPQQGDNELVIRSTVNDYTRSIHRGYNASISQDSRFLVCKIKPFYKETREARIKKKKTADMPKDSLAIIELGKDTDWKTDKVKSYKTPSKGYGWVAYQLEKPVEQPGIKLPEKKIAVIDTRVADSLNRVIDSLQALLKYANKKGKVKVTGKRKCVKPLLPCKCVCRMKEPNSSSDDTD